MPITNIFKGNSQGQGKGKNHRWYPLVKCTEGKLNTGGIHWLNALIENKIAGVSIGSMC